MSEDIRVSSPISIKENSAERVAFDLMNKIHSYDSRGDTENTDRKYWLALYSQCLKATRNYPVEQILKEG